MGLPKIEAPKYSCVLPVSGKKVEFRPFLAQEERVLLMASESKSAESYLTAMKDIVGACTYGAVDANSLVSVDLEFLFLNLRIRAVGETVSIAKECSYENCSEQIQHTINLDDIKFEYVDEYKANRKIDIGNGIGIVLRSPSAELAANLDSTEDSQTEKLYSLFKSSIETIYDSEQTYKASDYSDDELDAFVNTLPITVMQQIMKFFEYQPKMVYATKKVCPKCKKENEIKLEGMADFFT